MSHIDEIKSLLQTHGGPELARMLNTTERAIMYWIAENGAKTPRKETVQKIHELFIGNARKEDGISKTKEDKIFEELSYIRKSNDKLIDQQGSLVETNRKLADRLLSIDSDADQEKMRGLILETLVDVLVKIGVDAGSWKDPHQGLAEVGKMLSGKIGVKSKRSMTSG